MTATATTAVDHARTSRRTDAIPLSRVVRVELRKMFDTRSGFWLIASIGITGLIATVATVAFAPDDQLTYYTFAKAVGYPITVILPMVALLAITSEWSQRTGLTTFTYVSRRRAWCGPRPCRRSSWRSPRCSSPSPPARSGTSSAAASPASRRSGTSRSVTP
ncbi:hypothetical protein [Nocardioides ungokensis]|uniref:hypothetical protein n=1 Tax=Nocardioides ungokensis TaxID=1643322 RepID=UPI001FE9370C|nr:hypothetical protein [Nocardioides ungokensis]